MDKDLQIELEDKIKKKYGNRVMSLGCSKKNWIFADNLTKNFTTMNHQSYLPGLFFTEFDLLTVKKIK
ncbi:hypothetical protein BpHYR1_054393 [Brachionus plicatilis]|uniref:Uncharacterized protein n=1 Tax=Brachionus plicatilis TaxID=10195 RepID=A0A3M7QJG5_BRAPC|nr:hypothetical protein BpHYR1_054393 [Brachionus plicatilis]